MDIKLTQSQEIIRFNKSEADLVCRILGKLYPDLLRDLQFTDDEIERVAKIYHVFMWFNGGSDV